MALRKLPGLELTVCASIKKAKEILERPETRLPDMILLDLNLACELGTEFILYLKGNDQYRHIPAVVLSTSQTDKDVMECFGHGADAYVTKPHGFLQLILALKYLTEPEANDDQFAGLSDYIQYDFTRDRKYVHNRLKPFFPES